MVINLPLHKLLWGELQNILYFTDQHHTTKRGVMKTISFAPKCIVHPSWLTPTSYPVQALLQNTFTSVFSMERYNTEISLKWGKLQTFLS